MYRSIAKIGKKALSLFLVFVLVLSMVPMLAIPAKAAPADDYAGLVARLEAARDSLRGMADSAGTIDFGNGYTVDLEAVLLAYANDIDRDLDVAAALADLSATYTDSRLTAAQIIATNANASRFSTAFGSDQNARYNSAILYLTQGGIAKYSGNIISVTYFFAYKSRLNPEYSASRSLGSLSESGKLPSGTTLADRAESFAGDVNVTVTKLFGILDTLNGYKDEADGIYTYLAALPCPVGENETHTPEECIDWTHRLLVDEAAFTAAVNEFKADIERDISIVSDLATGRIDTGLWSAEKNGRSYYNSTAAPTALARLNAAIKFLEDGGYTCGSCSWGNWDNRLTYKSNLNTMYTVSDPTPLVGNSYSESGQESLVSLADGFLSILQLGALPGDTDALRIVYNQRVALVQAEIAKVYQLDPGLPEGATYTQEEYTAAIASFLMNAQRDLDIAEMLRVGTLVESEASTWVDSIKGLDSTIKNLLGLKDLSETFTAMSEAQRYSNAIRYFNEAGYGYGASLFGYGLQLEYRSDFYPVYSSGLLGFAANKTNLVSLISETAACLALGKPYMTKSQLEQAEYEAVRTKLLAIKDDPSEIVDELMANNEELSLLLSDLNTLVGSLDAIVNIIDSISRLGIDTAIINSLLEMAGTGITYEQLEALASLRDMLNDLGIDTSGEVSLTDEMKDFIKDNIGSFLGAGIDAELIVTDGLAAAGMYSQATSILQITLDGLTTSAATEITRLLGGITAMIEPIRPYLAMLDSSLGLVSDIISLYEQIVELTEDLSFGKLATATETLSSTLNNLANFLTAYEDSGLYQLLLELVSGTDIGGTLTGGLAGLLETYLNGLLGSDIVDLSGLDLSAINNIINELTVSGLSNPTRLVALLRASSSLLSTIAKRLDGIQDLIDGNYRDAFDKLTSDLGGTISQTVNVFEELVKLFTSQGASAAEVQMLPLTIKESIEAEAQNTFDYLCNPNVSLSDKIARYKEFERFIKNIFEFAKEIKDSMDCIEDLIEWADENLTQENARDFAERLLRHYAEELLDCLKNKISLGKISEILGGVKELAGELFDLCNEIRKAVNCVEDLIEWAEENLTAENARVFAKKLALHYATKIYNCVKDGIQNSGIPAVVEDIKDCAKEIRDIISFVKSTGALEIISTPGAEDVFYTFTTNYDELIEKLQPVLDALGVTTGYSIISPAYHSFLLDGNALKAAGALAGGSYEVGIEFWVHFDVCDYDVNISLASTIVTVEITAPPAKYTVTFDPDSGSLTDGAQNQVTVDEGTEITLPNASRTGFTFDGWYDTETLVGTAGGKYTVTKDVTLAAKWTENEVPPTKYTVTFNPGSGSITDGAQNQITVDEGTEITLPNASRVGYTFDGWYENTTLVGIAGARYTVTKDVTLTAGWTLSGGLPPVTEIEDEDPPLTGLRELLSLDTDSKDGIVYYYEGDEKVFVPFCFVIGDKIYFFGDSMTTYYVEPNPKAFSDIAGHWAFENILFSASRELYQGFPDGSFHPDASMTRAMFVTVLSRLALANTDAFGYKVFDDVDPDSWYGPAVAWAYNFNIVAGVGNNMFEPDANITRQDIVLILYRFLDYMDLPLTEISFTEFGDLDKVSSWALDAVIFMQKYGIVQGRENGMFDPRADSTRAEVATMLRRLIEAAIMYEYNAQSDELNKA